MAEKVSNKSVLFNPLSKNNPVIVQVLGICEKDRSDCEKKDRKSKRQNAD